MKLTTIALFVFGVALGGGGVYSLTNHGVTSGAPVSAVQPVKPLRTASALGRIQPRGGVVALGVSLPDQLARLFVEEGQEVEAGAVLAELASHGDRQLDVDLLDSQIKEAEERLKEIDQTAAFQQALDRLQLKQIEDQGRLDIKMQNHKLTFLKKQADQAREALERIKPLSSVSKQEKDQQEILSQQAQAELDGASDLLEKLTVGREMSLQLAQAKMNLARATLERARKDVPLTTLTRQRAIAAHRLEQTFVKAPTKGKILKTLARSGEMVGALQPVFQMADLSQMAVVAEVYESDIHKIEIGQVALITSKVENARKLTGKVVAVGSIIGKNRVYDADPLADVDRRVIEVNILLDQPAPASGLINLQVNVEFQPREP
jgi:HlyD family secretion protein